MAWQNTLLEAYIVRSNLSRNKKKKKKWNEKKKRQHKI